MSRFAYRVAPVPSDFPPCLGSRYLELLGHSYSVAKINILIFGELKNRRMNADRLDVSEITNDGRRSSENDFPWRFFFFLFSRINERCLFDYE